jgi:asparagine synthase (glutamine-hydrolysing)
MLSASGRSTLCYNGEIYNADDLRSQLSARGIRFRGRSDTEVILEAFEAWGIESALKRVVGMFALAWWDGATRTLWLARDRLGKKPLYFCRMGSSMLFGSQLKCLAAHPQWSPEIDRDALTTYMRFGYFSSAASVFKGVRQVAPGTVLSVRTEGSNDKAVVEHVFWDAVAVVQGGRADPIDAPDQEILTRLEELLSDAVRRRMIADVPLGAFLSGGIDSSTVVALMQKQSAAPVKTFTIGFSEREYDEAPFAAAVAQHLGTDHRQLYVSAATMLEAIPHLANWYDEPFADASAIPTLLLSRLARSEVTVALTGDGGDELFYGYPRYRFGAAVSRAMELMPHQLRTQLAAAVLRVPVKAWDCLSMAVPWKWRPERVGDRVLKAAKWMRLPSQDLVFREINSLWLEPEAVVAGASEAPDPRWTGALARRVPDFLDRMACLDLITYLPDDILAKVDRASMAVSLEARTPILDHRVVEFVWRLPRRHRTSGRCDKVLLRRLLDRYVPRHLVERPKKGFDVPIAAWLRGPLRDWAEDLLDEKRLSQDGVLNPAPIRQLWAEHQSGLRNWQHALWTVLMFQEWKRRWA